LKDGVRVILITDDAMTDDALIASIEGGLAAVPPGSVAVQLRDRSRDGGALLRRAEKVAAVVRARHSLLLVNDRLDIARWVGADGVHLGSRSVGPAEARSFLGAEAVITVAAHTEREVLGASEAGASAALVSPIFATPGKGAPRGIPFLAEACRTAFGGLAIFALGGVDMGNAGECVAAGAAGVAVIRAVLGAKDPGQALAELVRRVDESRRSRSAY
jgi:thiamine-phosphate pyrophosphorylase